MPIKLSSYVTWSTSETLPSVQLPLNAVFLVSHVTFVRTSCGRDFGVHSWATILQLVSFPAPTNPSADAFSIARETES